jgi:hypothetical protein
MAASDMVVTVKLDDEISARLVKQFEDQRAINALLTFELVKLEERILALEALPGVAEALAAQADIGK